MEIQLLYFEGCPNVEEAASRVRDALGDRPEVSVIRHQVADIEEAERVGMHGSPTILIDGTDPFDSDDTLVSWSCRVYGPDDGSQGVPSLERLVEVLG